jgi:hypothetical protein
MCGDQVSVPDEPEAAKWLRGEPRLDELLADPVLGSLLRSDGVDPARFRVFLDEQRRSARARRQRDRVDEASGLAHSIIVPGGR